MRKLSFIPLALTPVFCLTGSKAMPEGIQNSPEPPNIVVFIADDLGYGELGCQGNSQIPTPNIDAISSNGVRFSAAYVTAPNCSPSRAGFLTGRIPTRFGYEFNPIGARNENPGTGLPLSQQTLANTLHDAGYATALVGKWHLGGTADFHPMRRGFDEFFGFLHEGHYYAYPWWNGVTTMLRRKILPDGSKGRWVGDKVVYYTALGHDEPPYDANNPILRGSQPVEEPEYLTDAFTREGLSFIERHQHQPFLLMMSFNAVHSPMQGADAYMERFAWIEDIQRRIFAAMLANMDSSVGSIIQKLNECGLYDNTIIVFFSDNGGPTLELTSSNAPLRGGKGTMYEGGIRIPFMMQWNDRLPAGSTFDRAVSTMDLFPTFAAAAGIRVPEGLDGVNLLPYLKGEKEDDPHDFLFWRQGKNTAFRKGEWKLVRQARWNEPGQWELFNLAEDMEEKQDVADQFPDLVNELQKEWEAMDREMSEPVF